MHYFPPGPFRQVTLEATGTTYCIDPDPIVTEQNLRAAALLPGADDIVEITFDDPGADALREFTQQWISRPVAIFVDDELLSVPRIQAVFHRAQISLADSSADSPIDAAALADQWQRWATSP